MSWLAFFCGVGVGVVGLMVVESLWPNEWPPRGGSKVRFAYADPPYLGLFEEDKS